MTHKRPDDDYFPTPDALCHAAVRVLLPGEFRPSTAGSGISVLDPGCGSGAWGRALRARLPHARIVGVEQDAGRIAVAREAYTYVLWGDFLKIRRWPLAFDFIVGNPPYALAEAFIMRSLELLRPGGMALFLLRTAFMESQGRYERMFSGIARPTSVYSLVERPSFTGDGKTDATAYSLFLWHTRDFGQPGRPPTDIHHVKYPPWGTFEKDASDLLAICHECHCEIHGKAS